MVAPARVLTVTVLGMTLLAGCSSGVDPLVPDDLYVEVSEADRERNYDLAWQDIARLNGAIERGDDEAVSNNALLAAARVARLESGQPEWLDDRATARELEDYRQRWDAQDETALREALAARGPELRALFDSGQFDSALSVALEILVLAERAMMGSPGSGEN